MLIDLGTNGEMVIGNKDRRIATSTAAGPAFEGGNISCGIGSVKGAICSVTLEDGGMHWQTIGGGAPVEFAGPVFWILQPSLWSMALWMKRDF